MISALLKNKNSSGRMMAMLSLSNLFSNALTVVSGLLVAKWLIPEELGLFNSFSIMTSYIILIQLGVPSGLSRELPFFMGQKNEEKARKLASVAQYWGMILGLFCLGVAVLVSLYFVAVGSYELAAGSFVIGATSFQALYVTKYLKILYRSNSDFNKLSLIQVIGAVTAFVSIVFIWKFGFYGLCVRAVLVVLVDLYFAIRWKPMQIKTAWSKELYVELMKVGFPIYWVANVYSLWPVVQRTMILSLGGTKALGLFSLAVIIENAMKTISDSISSVSFPKMSFEWGRGISFVKLLKMPLKPVAAAVLVYTGIAVVGWYLLPLFVELFLPNYAGGIKAAQWTLIVALVSAFSVFSNIYMVVRKNTDRLISFAAGVSAWFIACYLQYRMFGFDLTIFPISVIIGYLCIYIVDAFNFRRYMSTLVRN